MYVKRCFCFKGKVTRVVHTRQIKTQPMMDIVIAIISVPLLVTFSFMLQRHMRSDWLHNLETRWRILGLGLSLLFISLVVCLYVIHRLGLCIWAAQQQRELRQNPEICRRVTQIPNNNCPPSLAATNSQIQLMVGGGELPPSYDSIMKNSDFPPPPYLSVLIYNEKNDTVPEVNDKEQNIQTITNTEPSFNQERSQETFIPIIPKPLIDFDILLMPLYLYALYLYALYLYALYPYALYTYTLYPYALYLYALYLYALYLYALYLCCSPYL
ncbi:hypothetical protein Phum_PHUM352970 [Pediculus humanus corporis]|uniref:Uncharacterized protein n=1 Tax=Pediculus humanus subsp. corporis TaxID=121224 RepID=E0VP63_PEDHC|nr:uncharacterized protein Phum_PHUM352970 [Pediculus humanus corporis]EEB15169.1 hypothetical protein Phum_PHUM352970 [Pediculus humanus corporis]